MTEQDVTDVTRNAKHVEIKLALDLAAWVATLYFITHPDAFDILPSIAKKLWWRTVHNLSVWTARQDIRSLPETEED